MAEFPFTKVLIANRGEIACRLITTCHRLGIRTVAVYSTPDQDTKHVHMAGESIRIGEAPATESYLNVDALIQACIKTGADAVLSGYGFLSENEEFVRRCEEQKIVFVGPTVDNISKFALKHKALQLAAEIGIPILPGSPLMNNIEDACTYADKLGYPVMVKSTAGGGGLGMSCCYDKTQVAEAFAKARRIAISSFGQDGVYIEKCVESARHIEVQVFGDKRGRVICLGERECSIQRRYQKIIEETPSPFVNPKLRQNMCTVARRLCEHIKYQSAGTVEFVVDSNTSEFYFLEVNTRLQVEHGITELTTPNVRGTRYHQSPHLDIVEWMLRLAGDDPEFQDFLKDYHHQPHGHAIECRVYAEDPSRAFRPCTGTITCLECPQHDWVRYDTWICNGTTITPFYDPLIMKIMVYGETRDTAMARMITILSTVTIQGVQTNLDYLNFICQHESFRAGETFTTLCDTLTFQAPALETLSAGMYSSLQSYPGRCGLWHVGVPPSGGMDNLSLRFANRLVGNDQTESVIEMTIEGASFKIQKPCTIAVTGAECPITYEDRPLPQYTAVTIDKGILKVGRCSGHGIRIYLAIAGGFIVKPYLGSTSTFPLGKLGGLRGQILEIGDMIPFKDVPAYTPPALCPPSFLPRFESHWIIGALYGPHGAPDFFTEDAILKFWKTHWKVHHNSNRLGIRLIGPTPTWSRTDGGEAGLHPSNIHDCMYAIGSVNYTGDKPIILGVDGPSLGGFVCPATIAQAELWKMGQLKPGDTLQFVRLSHEAARQMRIAQDDALESVGRSRVQTYNNYTLFPSTVDPQWTSIHDDKEVDTVLFADSSSDLKVCIRAQGDGDVLIEYGEMVLDLDLRIYVWCFMTWMENFKKRHPVFERAIKEISPGVRSVQVQYDNRYLTVQKLLDIIRQTEYPVMETLVLPSRRLRLPLAFDDRWNREAIDRYTHTVCGKTPYLPSNIDFVARINGLETGQEVLDIMLEATYVVMGLGDVYLGAPCAVPVDPRHRLITSKYNPARTYTPEGSVGLGGSYLCIYGMESPGGYQLVARTLPIWKTFDDTPYLLRFFDQITFYQVSDDELAHIRNQYKAGHFKLDIEDTVFSVHDYHQLLQTQHDSIRLFKGKQQRSFQKELDKWIQGGMIGADSCEDDGDDNRYDEEIGLSRVEEGTVAIVAVISGNIWKVDVKEGQDVAKDQCVVILEAMKMEFKIKSPHSGKVLKIVRRPGHLVHRGDPIIILKI